MKWFRLYHDMIGDPKIGALEDSVFRLWVEILCLASQNRDGGDTGKTVTETAWKLRRNGDSGVAVPLQKLLCNGLVTLQKRSDGGETIFVPGWNTRQYQSDSSTERVNKYRKKRYSNGDETEM